MQPITKAEAIERVRSIRRERRLLDELEAALLALIAEEVPDEDQISKAERALWPYIDLLKNEQFTWRAITAEMEAFGIDDVPTRAALSMSLIRLAQKGFLTLVEKGEGRKASLYEVSQKGREFKL